MKPKEFLYMLGLRPRVRRYGHEQIDLADPDGGAAIRWVRWEHPKSRDLRPTFDELPLLRRILAGGDFAIDVGAHVGDTTLPIAAAVGEHGLVLALEPNPATFEILRLNATVNPGRMQIDCLNAAAMDEAGEYEFHYNDPGLTNGGYQKHVSKWDHASFFAVKVRGVRLDSYLSEHYADRLDRLRYIKTDCEGYDYQVFKSIRSLVARSRPTMKIEVNRYTPAEQAAALYRDLGALDYRIFRHDAFVRDERIEIDPQRPIKAPETIDILAVPGHRAAELI